MSSSNIASDFEIAECLTQWQNGVEGNTLTVDQRVAICIIDQYRRKFNKLQVWMIQQKSILFFD